jgi:hypothetical protein
MILQLLSSPLGAVTEPSSVTDLAQISALPNPPLVALKPEDIHVRRCRLAGDAVDAHFGCFRTHDLERLLALTNGAPALVGHNRSTVAVARFFGGAVESHDGHKFIVPRFYWPQAHSGAEDFRVLLDAGIITEASIAFTFDKPSCSICGKDIRECEHEPGTLVGMKLCHYYYDGIDRVLEGSFVYRGAQPNTGILPELPAGALALKNRKTLTVRYNGRVYTVMAPLAEKSETRKIGNSETSAVSTL